MTKSGDSVGHGWLPSAPGSGHSKLLRDHPFQGCNFNHDLTAAIDLYASRYPFAQYTRTPRSEFKMSGILGGVYKYDLDRRDWRTGGIG